MFFFCFILFQFLPAKPSANFNKMKSFLCLVSTCITNILVLMRNTTEELYRCFLTLLFLHSGKDYIVSHDLRVGKNKLVTGFLCLLCERRLSQEESQAHIFSWEHVATYLVRSSPCAHTFISYFSTLMVLALVTLLYLLCCVKKIVNICRK